MKGINTIFKYTTSDSQILTLFKKIGKVLSNTYENGQGIAVIEGEITELPTNCFYNCEKLESITIPNSVTSIGDHAFWGCNELINKVSKKDVYYKGFNNDLSCRCHQFKIGKVNKLDNNEPIGICKNGFHFCDNPLSVFNYYEGIENKDIVIYKVKPSGEIIQGDDHKHVCSEIELLESVTFKDIFDLLK